MIELLRHICEMMKELYFAAFSNKEQSDCADLTVPAGDSWIQLCSASVPSIFYFRNLDAANELMLTWNDKNAVGMRIPADTEIVLDCVSGTIFIKSASGADVNYGLIGRK